MGRVFVFLTLVVGGAMLADVLANPKGSEAAATGISDILTPSLQAAAGQKIS